MKIIKNFTSLILAFVFIPIMICSAYAEDAPPIGQSKGQEISDDEGIKSDIFGQKGGRFHPFLLFEEVFIDNLFATETNTQSDYVTTIAPGIWLAFPANRAKLLSIDTTTTSPGGLQLSRVKPEATRRYQTYFLYSPEFVFYSNHSSHDHVNHKAEALFQYNLNSGISFDLINLFNDREEIAGNGITDTLYRHQDNLFDFIISYMAPSGKLKVEVDFSNYYLDYKDAIVTERNRMDNSFGAAVYYKFWPKTSLFTEYNFSDITFDGASTYDSIENRYYLGTQWDITAKTRGTLKLGYIQKDFDDASVKDQDGVSVEIQTQHNLTPKRAIHINGFRKFQESDFGGASGFLSTGIDVSLLQRFSTKWSGTFSVYYEENEYNGVTRDDDLFGFGPAVRFEAKKWLIFDLGYTYHENDSSLAGNDYRVSQFFFRASLSM